MKAAAVIFGLEIVCSTLSDNFWDNNFGDGRKRIFAHSEFIGLTVTCFALGYKGVPFAMRPGL